MPRDSLTRTKRETLSTPFCKRVYRPSPVLLGYATSLHPMYSRHHKMDVYVAARSIYGVSAFCHSIVLRARFPGFGK